MKNPLVKTDCSTCVFYQGGEADCLTGRRNKFREIGVNVEGSIVDRFCNLGRAKEWADEVDSDIVEAARREVITPVCFIIVNNVDDYDEFRRLVQQQVDHISKFRVKPNEVIFTTVSGQIKGVNPGKIFLDVIRPLSNEYEFAVKGVHCFDEYDVNECIQKCHSQYYCEFKIDDTIKEDITYIVDRLINDKLIQFLVIEEDGVYPRVVQVILHKILSGNIENILCEKKMVMQWKEARKLAL